MLGIRKKCEPHVCIVVIRYSESLVTPPTSCPSANRIDTIHHGRSGRCRGSSDVLRSTTPLTRGLGCSRRDGAEKPVQPEIHPHTREKVVRCGALQYMLSTPSNVERTRECKGRGRFWKGTSINVWFDIPSDASSLTSDLSKNQGNSEVDGGEEQTGQPVVG